jgi:Rieske Fe-S protein
MDRRSFLAWAASASLGASGCFVLYTAAEALSPPSRSIDGTTKVGPLTVARLADLVPGTPLATEYGGEPIFVVKSKGGGLQVFSAACPHVRCKLAFNNRTREFDCPCHGSAFSIDGVRLRGPAPRNMVAATFRVVDGDVVVYGFEA